MKPWWNVGVVEECWRTLENISENSPKLKFFQNEGIVGTKKGGMLVERWQNFGRMLVEGWQNVGRILVERWQNLGRTLVQGWQNVGRILENVG